MKPDTATDPSAQPFASDLHCSLGDGRSYTDPVTNWTLISGVEIKRDLAQMMQAGRYPIAYLPDFLHEFVHHSCFQSPVGTALALIQLRARRTAVLLDKPEEAPPGVHVDQWALLDSVVRYETAIALMRPLAEGLALYAEFDAVPGDSPITSPAMLQAAVAFVDVKENTSDDPTLNAAAALLARRLVSLRRSDVFETRKANLLVQPLGPDGGGYLPGYLALKNLWHVLLNLTKSTKLFDTDLYFAFIRSFFYDDYAFVAALLDETKEIAFGGAGPIDCADAISTYFQRRWAQLSNVTEAQIADFEAAVLAGDPEAMPLFGADPALAERGRRVLEAGYAELDFDGPADSLEKVLRRRDSWTLAQRDLMCVGSFAVDVIVNEHHRVIVRERGGNGAAGFPVFAMQAHEDAQADQGEGSLEYFISPAGKYSVLTVTLHDKVVAVGSLSPNLTDTLRDQVLRYRTSHEKASADGRLWREVVATALRQDSSNELFLEHYRDNARRVTESLYFGKALMFTPDAALDHAIETTRKDGFYEILAGDFDLIRAAARLSLVNSVDMQMERAQKAFANEAIGIKAVIGALRAAEREKGVKLFDEQDGFLYCYF